MLNKMYITIVHFFIWIEKDNVSLTFLRILLSQFLYSFVCLAVKSKPINNSPENWLTSSSISTRITHIR